MRTSIAISCVFIVLAGCQTDSFTGTLDTLSDRASAAAAAIEPRHIADVERVDLSEYRSRPPETRAKSVPSEILSQREESPAVFTRQLVEYLTEGIEDPFLQVKVLHDWITLNIAYDADAYFSGNLPSQDFREVLTLGKAVCSGYANVLHRFVSHTNIRSYVISGYGRGYSSSVFYPVTPQESNHAWNAVHINGVWYLVDSTWNAGFLDGNQFRHSYSTAYLFLQPKFMIYTHFPMNSRHQLLANPVSAEEFASLPYYRGRFFAYGLQPFEGLAANASVEEEFMIEFAAPEGVVLTASLIDSDGVRHENRALAHTQAESGRVHVFFPSEGQWAVRLFARGPGVERGEWVADLSMVSQAGTPKVFPTLYSPFHRHRMELVRPSYGPLQYGASVPFELRMPGYHDGYLLMGNERVALDRVVGTDTFRAIITVDASDSVRVFARKSPNDRRYEGIASFPVGAL